MKTYSTEHDGQNDGRYCLKSGSVRWGYRRYIEVYIQNLVNSVSYNNGGFVFVIN